MLVAAFGGGRQGSLAALLGPVGGPGTATELLFYARRVAQGGGYRDRVLGSAVEQVARQGVVVALSPVGIVPQGKHHGPEAAAADAIIEVGAAGEAGFWKAQKAACRALRKAKVPLNKVEVK